MTFDAALVGQYLDALVAAGLLRDDQVLPAIALLDAQFGAGAVTRRADLEVDAQLFALQRYLVKYYRFWPDFEAIQIASSRGWNALCLWLQNATAVEIRARTVKVAVAGFTIAELQAFGQPRGLTLPKKRRELVTYFQGLPVELLVELAATHGLCFRVW